jgi:hypothetical protein
LKRGESPYTMTSVDEWFQRSTGPSALAAVIMLARDIPVSERRDKVVAIEGYVGLPDVRSLHIDTVARGAPRAGSGVSDLDPDESHRIFVMIVATGNAAPDGSEVCEISRGTIDLTQLEPGRFSDDFGAVPARACRARLDLGATVKVTFADVELTLATNQPGAGARAGD